MLAVLRRSILIASLIASAATVQPLVIPALKLAQVALTDDPAQNATALIALTDREAIALAQAEAKDDPELAASYTALLAERDGRTPEPRNLGDDAAILAALMLSLAADLTVVGDAHDLGEQALKYPDHDAFIVFMAGVGIVLTGATYGGGSALIPRVGVSVLKAAKKAGKLSAKLADDLVATAKRTVDWDALSKVPGAIARAALRLDLDELATTMARIIRKEAIDALYKTGEDIVSVAKAGGAGPTVRMLSTADNADDIARLRRLVEARPESGSALMHMAPGLRRGFLAVTRLANALLGYALAFWAWALVTLVTLLSILRSALSLAVRRSTPA